MQSPTPLLRRIATIPLRSMSQFLGNVRVLHGLTEQGDLVESLRDTSPVLEQYVTSSPSIRTFILNRPKALHALNTHMVSAIYNRLRSIELSSEIKCVIICSKGTKGKAFCAGGDVRNVYYAGREKRFDAIDDFFRTEYSMNSLIASLKKTVVLSILDGIVMGGGVGLSIYGKYRIATENTVLAMPECAIGLHPDVGASFYLSRLPSGHGMYMALTGARLKGMDVVAAGFATHFVPSESIPQLLEGLQTANTTNDSSILETLSRFETKVSPSSELPGASVVQEAFTLGSIEQIETSLLRIASGGEKNDGEFAKSALESLNGGCPTSLKVAFESITRGKSLSLDDCLKSEFRLTARCVRRHDFYAGVGSVLVTKDRNPNWKPSGLPMVSTDDVNQFFKPLETDVKIPELELDHWKALQRNACPQARM